MRKHLSVGMLLAGSTLVPVIGLLMATAAVEAALFFTAAAEERYLFLYGSRLPLMAGIGFVGLCAVLTLTGSFGSKTRYTLQRLSVTERTVTLWQGAYNAVCLLIAWGAQLGLLLLFWHLTRQTEGTGLFDQEAFTYFYRNGFAHSLLPLSEPVRLLRNAVLLLSLGMTGACFSRRLRQGKWSAASLVLMVGTVLFFGMPAGNMTMDMVLMIGAAGLTAAAVYRLWEVPADEV